RRISTPAILAILFLLPQFSDAFSGRVPVEVVMDAIAALNTLPKVRIEELLKRYRDASESVVAIPWTRQRERGHGVVGDEAVGQMLVAVAEPTDVEIAPERADGDGLGMPRPAVVDLRPGHSSSSNVRYWPLNARRTVPVSPERALSMINSR